MFATADVQRMLANGGIYYSRSDFAAKFKRRLLDRAIDVSRLAAKAALCRKVRTVTDADVLFAITMKFGPVLGYRLPRQRISKFSASDKTGLAKYRAKAKAEKTKEATTSVQ